MFHLSHNSFHIHAYCTCATKCILPLRRTQASQYDAAEGAAKGLMGSSELNVDNWNDNCEAKSEAKRPRPLRGLQVEFSLTRDVSYAVR